MAHDVPSRERRAPALSRDVGERFGSAREMLEALAAIEGASDPAVASRLAALVAVESEGRSE